MRNEVLYLRGDNVKIDGQTFFCDEAGNSGSNYLDASQPFYVTGGWLVPNTLKDDEDFINKIKQLLDKEGEMHAKNIVRSPKGRFKLKEIIQSLMLDFDLLPFICLTEKKFAIAAKVIETLLDPEYNDLVHTGITYDSLEKSKMYYADKIYNLNEITLESFASAYRNGDVQLMKESISLIAKQLYDNKEFELSNQVYASFKYIEENLTGDYDITNNSENKVMGSLNLPMFVVIMNMLEMHGLMRQCEINIVHDDILEFKNGYINYFNLMKKDILSDYIQVRDQVIPTCFNHIKSLEFNDSGENIFVQCADVLVCSVNRCICEFIKETTMDKSTLELWETVVPILFSWEKPKLSHFMVSGNVTIKIFESKLGDLNEFIKKLK